MIIETTDNRLFRVRETGDADLAHVWFGTRVTRRRTPDKRVIYVQRIPVRTELVRKAASRIVAQEG